jgi:hypothetical protein
MAQKQDKWEPCPRCESKKVESRGGCFFLLFGVGLIGISIWLLLLLPPVGIAGIVLGVVLMILSPMTKGMLQCQDCKYAWKYPANKEALKTGQSQLE